MPRVAFYSKNHTMYLSQSQASMVVYQNYLYIIQTTAFFLWHLVTVDQFSNWHKSEAEATVIQLSLAIK